MHIRAHARKHYRRSREINSSHTDFITCCLRSEHRLFVNKKVTSLCLRLRFVTKRDFDREQVEQQTSQPKLKRVSVG